MDKDRITYLACWADIDGDTSELEAVCKAYSLRNWYFRDPPADHPGEIGFTITVGYTTYEIAEKDLDRLDKSLQAIEEQLRDPKYIVRRSPALHDVVTNLLDGGRRDVVKAMSKSINMGAKGGKEVIRGMRFMAGLSGGPIVYLVLHGSTIFIFQADSEEEAIASLNPENVKFKQRVPAPASVLTKMISIRLQKIFAAVSKYNQQLASDRKERAEMNAAEIARLQNLYRGGVLPDIEPDVHIPDLTTIEALQEFVEKNNFNRVQGGAEKSRCEFKEILQKPGLTDEIVNSAWEAQMVREVMER